MIRLIIRGKPYAWYFLAGWLLAIITISSIPSLPTVKIHTEKSDIRLDYLIHFCEYGVLAFLAFLAFAGNDFRLRFKKSSVISLCLIAFAIVDEFHQKLIPGRAFNVKDIYSNIIGIVAAIIFCTIVFRNISGMKKSA
jgi:VanZ family protein